MWRDNEQPVSIRREDYQAFDFLIKHVSLRFDLDSNDTRVTSELDIGRAKSNSLASGAVGDTTSDAASPPSLLLDGVDLKLHSIAIDGKALDADDYLLEATRLIIHQPPESFRLSIVNSIDPANNTALEGLYQSSGNFCTQCEAQGFRKITYFPDRPDILATYDVTLVADKSAYPVLLANGNEVDRGDLADNKHWVRWEDPFPKPSYLFALVAGQLDHIADEYITSSGRRVELRIYVESHNIDRCDYAMRSLKQAMKWDEDVYSLEYDLDIFMIVAVDDFNMGAMENKGLNIFNSKFILADAETATDTDFVGVESVVAHEYFHNWTGNRITCRDWFQLSLKEGLTVFRDQEFSADLNSRAVKRVADVRLLRARQFPEDAGPMAHPIRPESYIEINNFYTVTIYEKGAEVIRMLHTLLGAELFHKGMDLYVKRHDGDAATCDDFVDAMQTASGRNLDRFKHWYTQAGTPDVRVNCRHDANSGHYTMAFSQYCPPTPGQKNKRPFHMPVRVGLIDVNGKPVALSLVDQSTEAKVADEHVLELTEKSQEFVFENIPAGVVPSLFRNFSAPISLDYEFSDQDLARLTAHDTDPFNRWEATQRLAKRIIKRIADSLPESPALSLSDVADDFAHQDSVDAFVHSIASCWEDGQLDDAQRADMLVLPAIEVIPDASEIVDIDRLYIARKWLKRILGEALQKDLRSTFESIATSEALDSAAMGKRRLKNICLDALSSLPESEWLDLAFNHYAASSLMTDRAASLSVLCGTTSEKREQALEDFYKRFSDNKLVIDKWFAIQAAADSGDSPECVIVLSQHEAFTLNNPNRVRSLYGVFAMNNPTGFHRRDGKGYALVGEAVRVLDGSNPQVAARLVSAFSQWRRFDGQRQTQMQEQLKKLSNHSDLSPDVFEIVTKSLAPS